MGLYIGSVGVIWGMFGEEGASNDSVVAAKRKERGGIASGFVACAIRRSRWCWFVAPRLGSDVDLEWWWWLWWLGEPTVNKIECLRSQ